FPIWAREPGYRMVAGDFNGDGRSDIAMTGATLATTIPVAFSAVTVTLRVEAFASVGVNIDGASIGTCSSTECQYVAPVGSTVRLTSDKDVVSWGPGPCQDVHGSAPCTFVAEADHTFDVHILG
ncbi:hypothetical protein, partial [Nonomuraea dietziae]|uniref:hypothetical protein n=1 Tax=Nonomuraea dietziae TaxID=65515 RepID=UPI0033DB92A1